MTQLDRAFLPHQYFMWLYNRVCLVGDVESPLSYTLLCRKMHRIDFKVLVDYDENRVGDVANLRNRFLTEVGGVAFEPADILDPAATVFEVLVSLAERAHYMVQLGPEIWFRKFLENLDLLIFTDRHCLARSTGRVDKILKNFNDRHYRASGEGGLFPLTMPIQDQRRIELWYQMAAYMTENHMY